MASSVKLENDCVVPFVDVNKGELLLTAERMGELFNRPALRNSPQHIFCAFHVVVLWPPQQSQAETAASATPAQTVVVKSKKTERKAMKAAAPKNDIELEQLIDSKRLNSLYTSIYITEEYRHHQKHRITHLALFYVESWCHNPDSQIYTRIYELGFLSTQSPLLLLSSKSSFRMIAGAPPPQNYNYFTISLDRLFQYTTQEFPASQHLAETKVDETKDEKEEVGGVEIPLPPLIQIEAEPEIDDEIKFDELGERGQPSNYIYIYHPISDEAELLSMCELASSTSQAPLDRELVTYLQAVIEYYQRVMLSAADKHTDEAGDSDVESPPQVQSAPTMTVSVQTNTLFDIQREAVIIHLLIRYLAWASVLQRPNADTAITPEQLFEAFLEYQRTILEAQLNAILLEQDRLLNIKANHVRVIRSGLREAEGDIDSYLIEYHCDGLRSLYKTLCDVYRAKHQRHPDLHSSQLEQESRIYGLLRDTLMQYKRQQQQQ